MEGPPLGPVPRVLYELRRGALHASRSSATGAAPSATSTCPASCAPTAHKKRLPVDRATAVLCAARSAKTATPKRRRCVLSVAWARLDNPRWTRCDGEGEDGSEIPRMCAWHRCALLRGCLLPPTRARVKAHARERAQHDQQLRTGPSGDGKPGRSPRSLEGCSARQPWCPRFFMSRLVLVKR